MLDQLLPIIFLFIVVIAFGTAMVVLTQLVGAKAPRSKVKGSPYECGVPGQAPATTKTPVKFYLTAISFILFDIEVVFLYPWTLIYMDNIKAYGQYLLGAMGIFMAILIVGLAYELKAGALEWD
jgi:NADH-quinone oxidoreductase subunit A